MPSSVAIDKGFPKPRVHKPQNKAAAIAKGRTKEQLWVGIPQGLPELLDGSTSTEEAALFEMKRRQRVEKDEINHIDMKNDRNTMRTFNIWLLVAGLLTFVALFFCVLGLISKSDAHLEVSRFAEGASRVLPTTVSIVGYSDWGNFSSQCCCIAFVIPANPGANSTADSELLSLFTTSTTVNGSVVTQAGRGAVADYVGSKLKINLGVFRNGVAKVEKWVCANGNVKERVRATRVSTNPEVLIDSTSSIRGFCATTFISPDCAPEVLPPTGSGSTARVRLNCPTTTISDDEKAMW